MSGFPSNPAIFLAAAMLLWGGNPGWGDSGFQTKGLQEQEQKSASGWASLKPVVRPSHPAPAHSDWARNPIDLFVAAEQEKRGLKPRPEAAKEVLLRRVYLDLIGLSPTREEQAAFAADSSAEAYEKVVDRLLNDPRFGERWGRHWMDIWRYSDWAGWSGGNQVRDSQPHVWRWRDWIVEALNSDLGYDRMILEMLAGDELAGEDPEVLRATGYLVRNYKMLSREQWLEDTVKHTSQAFLGVTLGCAKCHDHMTDPISQAEYYQLRAIFEPHQVRTDRIPGVLDTAKDGVARAYDADLEKLTYFFNRGDEREPDTNRVMQAAVPVSLARFTGPLEVRPVPLPKEAAFPDKREFVVRDWLQARENAVIEARNQLEKKRSEAGAGNRLEEWDLRFELEAARLLAARKVVEVESINQEEAEEQWIAAAQEASQAQREVARLEARLELHAAARAWSEAKEKLEAAQPAEKEAEGAELSPAEKELEKAVKKKEEAEKALESAEAKLLEPAGTDFKPRPAKSYPEKSTGRRLAFARWMTHPHHPLTARVAANHIWLRHFGRGLAPNPSDFGALGQAATHPELLDWLAAELMDQNWRMKALHRLIATSSAYRMASTPDPANLARDPDNIYLWRKSSRRMEAELVRDNLLYISGELDPAMGGSEIDHALGMESKRRSLYLRIAAEKEVEFLKVFDGPTVTECYERRASVMPQQALALANSELGLNQSKRFARGFAEIYPDDGEFIGAAFTKILARPPSSEEMVLCLEFLGNSRGELAISERVRSRRENLILVLFNHNEFITIR
jgi:hypothetical protein